MPRYRKFMKDLLTKIRALSLDFADNVNHCNAIDTSSLVQTKEDHRAFTIPCIIGVFNSTKALCDLGISINLIPLVV